MMHIYKPKRKCRTVNFPTLNLLRLGLVVSSVIVATINVTQVNALIGGAGVLRDEWPFIAALYYTRTSKYFCGGTIISHRHVLTTANCLQAKGKDVPLSPDKITVRLRAYNLTDRSEEGVVDRNVTQIHVHPDWNFYNKRYDADIAILFFNENVKFSNHIRPVCMPPRDFLIDGLNGIVAGWGITENGTAEGIPRRIESNALNDDYCYRKYERIARYTSEHSFCGESSGTPADGDSGGGFFAVAGSGWVQFGAVSFVSLEAAGNVLKLAVYVKLTSLRDWIAETVEQSGDKICLATTKINLNCSDGYTSAEFYGCWLHDLNIRHENFEVDNFTGSHNFGKDNEDVELIAFKTGAMASLPRNFGKFLKNLKFLLISVYVRHIVRSNFQNLERLEMIGLVNSSVSELDEDSLWYLPNLQSFELNNCKLKLLHAATFSRNYKLTIVHITFNILKALPQNLFRNNSLLESVSFNDNLIETVDENILETNPKLRAVSLKKNCLRHLRNNLFQKNSELLTIDLSNNRIMTIDEQRFKSNSKLLSLHLESNELEFLPAQLLRGLSFLKEFHLEKKFVEIDRRATV